jgi:hypothetical protein
MMKSLVFALLACFSLVASANNYPPMGDSMQQFGDYQVHYNVFNSSFLTPEIAHENQLKRAKNTALLNVSVLKKQDDDTYRGITAAVKGTHDDLVRKERLEFKEIVEENAVYYIASFVIHHRIDVFFTVEVQVEGEPKPFKVQWQRRLYHDDK